LRSRSHRSSAPIALPQTSTLLASTSSQDNPSPDNPRKDVCSYSDSGSASVVFHNPRVFVPGSLLVCESRSISLADKSEVRATHVGEVVLPFENAKIRLTDVYLVPDLGFNLVSVGRLADKGITATFKKGFVTASCRVWFWHWQWHS
jgi:hypothetical protein